jgi:hypothetical protein
VKAGYSRGNAQMKYAVISDRESQGLTRTFGEERVDITGLAFD